MDVHKMTSAKLEHMPMLPAPPTPVKLVMSNGHTSAGTITNQQQLVPINHSGPTNGTSNEISPIFVTDLDQVHQVMNSDFSGHFNQGGIFQAVQFQTTDGQIHIVHLKVIGIDEQGLLCSGPGGTFLLPAVRGDANPMNHALAISCNRSSTTPLITPTPPLEVVTHPESPASSSPTLVISASTVPKILIEADTDASTSIPPPSQDIISSQKKRNAPLKPKTKARAEPARRVIKEDKGIVKNKKFTKGKIVTLKAKAPEVESPPAILSEAREPRWIKVSPTSPVSVTSVTKPHPHNMASQGSIAEAITGVVNSANWTSSITSTESSQINHSCGNQTPVPTPPAPRYLISVTTAAPEGIKKSEPVETFDLKCIVCLRRGGMIEDIFEKDGKSPASPLPKLLPNMAKLISYFHFQFIPANPTEIGICASCLDSLQCWDIFHSAVMNKHHEVARNPGPQAENTPINYESFERNMYKNFNEILKAKEVHQQSAIHSRLMKRHLTNKDWELLLDHLNGKPFVRNLELEKYFMESDKLTHIFCVACQSYISFGKIGFITHMKTKHGHHYPIALPCDICGEYFPEASSTVMSASCAPLEGYFQHWTAHFCPYYCKACGKRYRTANGLEHHKEKMHTSGSSPVIFVDQTNENRPWKCNECVWSFKTKAALMSHTKSVHLQVKDHKCHICNECFKSASALRFHVRRHGKKEHQCDVCFKEFFTNSALEVHKITHQIPKDFVCGICDKGFNKKKALDEHLTLHTGDKPYECPICGRRVRVKSNLYKHLKVHQKAGEGRVLSAHAYNEGEIIIIENLQSEVSSETCQPKNKEADVEVETVMIIDEPKSVESSPTKPEVITLDEDVTITEVEEETIQDEPVVSLAK